jgi:hypothetical protein
MIRINGSLKRTVMIVRHQQKTRVRSSLFVQERRLLGNCGTPPQPKKKSVLELFKSIGKQDPIVVNKVKQDPHARALLTGKTDTDEDEEDELEALKGGVKGGLHGDHAREIEKDLKAKLVGKGHGHSHSHGDTGEHGHSHEGGEHGHSHSDDEHAHSHSHGQVQARKISIEEDEDDFVEMWNPNAPAGPEHGGPRGLEPTRYKNEWEKKGRVTDFT